MKFYNDHSFGQEPYFLRPRMSMIDIPFNSIFCNILLAGHPLSQAKMFEELGKRHIKHNTVQIFLGREGVNLIKA